MCLGEHIPWWNIFLGDNTFLGKHVLGEHISGHNYFLGHIFIGENYHIFVSIDFNQSGNAKVVAYVNGVLYNDWDSNLVNIVELCLIPMFNHCGWYRTVVCDSYWQSARNQFLELKQSLVQSNESIKWIRTDRSRPTTTTPNSKSQQYCLRQPIVPILVTQKSLSLY